MREEILRAGGTRMLSGFPGMSGGAENTIGDGGDRQPGSSLPALCGRAAMSAFLNGRDFEDVLRRAVSLGGNSADIAAIAGSIAEAFFGIPDEIRDACLQRLPVDLRTAAKSFEVGECPDPRLFPPPRNSAGERGSGAGDRQNASE